MSTEYNVIGLWRGGTPESHYPKGSREYTHLLVELPESKDVLSWSSNGLHVNEHPLSRLGTTSKCGKELVYCGIGMGSSGVVCSRESVPMRRDHLLTAVRDHFKNIHYTCLPPDNCHAIVDFLREYKRSGSDTGPVGSLLNVAYRLEAVAAGDVPPNPMYPLKAAVAAASTHEPAPPEPDAGPIGSLLNSVYRLAAVDAGHVPSNTAQPQTSPPDPGTGPIDTLRTSVTFCTIVPG